MSSLFDFERHPDQYAVMGNPISHSKSPAIHRLFAQQTHQNIEYQAIQVDVGGFKQAVGNFFANGGSGLNITVPFKREAWELCNELSKRAKAAGAVNTLLLNTEGEICGDNTDGIGLVNDLCQNHHVKLEGARILLLGAGGAARGVIQPLLHQGPEKIVIANRTIDKAHELAEYFATSGPTIARAFDALDDEDFTLIINATSASLHGEVPSIPYQIIKPHSICYDMMYGATTTAFMHWAVKMGAHKCIDGLGMLVEQAAESFFIWRGVRPQTQPVIAQIRQELSQ